MTASLQYELPLVGGAGVAPVSPWKFNRRARGIDRCESPLERQLALAFAEVEPFAWRANCDHPWCVGRWEQLSLVLLAQPTCGPFRADFAIVRRGARPGDPLPLIAEVDGFEFHATREQARFDRRRDRYLIERGARVLRYSGAEVWRDAAACAIEAVRVARRVAGAPLNPEPGQGPSRAARDAGVNPRRAPNPRQGGDPCHELRKSLANRPTTPSQGTRS